MVDFHIKRLPYNLTAHAVLSLIGQYLKRFAQIDQIIDPKFPIKGAGGIPTSSLIKSYVGLLCTGKSDFDAIESLRKTTFSYPHLALPQPHPRPRCASAWMTMPRTTTRCCAPLTKPTCACSSAPNL